MAALNDDQRSKRIRDLNDAFRRTFLGIIVLCAAGVVALPETIPRKILSRVRGFDAFTSNNDPHGEHDFGAIDTADHFAILADLSAREGNRTLPKAQLASDVPPQQIAVPNNKNAAKRSCGNSRSAKATSAFTAIEVPADLREIGSPPSHSQLGAITHAPVEVSQRLIRTCS